MLRILVVTNAYPTPRYPANGAFNAQQIAGLQRRGLEVEMMFVDRREEGMKSYFTMGTDIRNRVQHFRPDVVHVMYGGVFAERVTSTVKDKPIVVSFCGSDLLGESTSGVLRSIIGKCGVVASHVAARRAVGIIVKSRNLEQALPADVDRLKVKIIPNGVDLDRFKPLEQVDCRRKLGWSLNKFHVLFPTNSGDSVKRPHLAQAAIEAANGLGLNAEMHQLRGVSHAEVPIWLNASDTVILTSSHEGSPNIVKEALACNVPVVSVDVGDVRERIDGIDGCHIAQSDPHDLGAKLGLVKARGERIAGRERMQPLSVEENSLKVLRFYDECLESWQKRERN